MVSRRPGNRSRGGNGTILKYDAPGHPLYVVWAPLDKGTGYFSPSTREHTINFAVDDLSGFVEYSRRRSVEILDFKDDDPNGLFALIMDPESTMIELWQPVESSP